jgi:hypothetical protein
MRDVEISDQSDSTKTEAGDPVDWSWYDPVVEQREKRLVFLIAMPIALGVASAGMIVAERVLGPGAGFPTYLILSAVFLALGEELEPRSRPQHRTVVSRVVHRAVRLALGLIIALLVFAAFGWRLG